MLIEWRASDWMPVEFVSCGRIETPGLVQHAKGQRTKGKVNMSIAPF